MTQMKTTKPSKQRKRYFAAPYHQRNRRMTALLTDDLREKYGIKHIPIRKGDKIRVFRAKGSDQDIKGKVIRVLPQKYCIHVEGFSREKADGKIVMHPVHPSNVVVTSLNLKDKKRREIIKRKSKKKLTDEILEADIFDEDEEIRDETEEMDEEFDDFEEDFESDLEEEKD